MHGESISAPRNFSQNARREWGLREFAGRRGWGTRFLGIRGRRCRCHRHRSRPTAPWDGWDRAAAYFLDQPQNTVTAGIGSGVTDVRAHGHDAAPFAERNMGDDLERTGLHGRGSFFLAAVVASGELNRAALRSPRRTAIPSGPSRRSQSSSRPSADRGCRPATSWCRRRSTRLPTADLSCCTRRETMLCQSIGWISTLIPTFSSCALATGAICFPHAEIDRLQHDDRRAVVFRLRQQRLCFGHVALDHSLAADRRLISANRK